jgi:hypothetical protein
MDIAEILEALGSQLGREPVPFAIVGALALHTYGYSRVTNDVDLLVGSDVQDRLIEFLEREGFETLHRSSGFSNHLHSDPKRGRLDVIYVDPQTRERIFTNGRTAVLHGVTVTVPKPEHLAAMKVHAMKNDPTRTFKEMADIQFLMGLPEVDRSEIRKYFQDAGLKERFDELEQSL